MKRAMLVIGLMVVGAGLAVGQTMPRPGAEAGNGPMAVLLEQGIYQEETAGNVEAAAKTYRQIVEQAAVTRGLAAQALARLAGVQVKQKQMDEALRTIERLKMEYPEQKDLIAKAQAGLPTAALVQSTTRPVATAEQKAEAQKLLAQGWALMQERKFAEAETQFRLAGNLDSNSATYNALGWALLNQGRAEEIYFRSAVELDPKNAAAWNGLGWINSSRGNREEAAKYWLKSVEADGAATAAMSGLAQNASDAGRYEEAVGWYEKWLKVDPQNADATIGLNRAKQMLEATKDAQAAVDAYLKLLDEGEYAKSWEKMGSVGPVVAADAQKWEDYCKIERAPLGKVESRKVDTLQAAGPGARLSGRGVLMGGGGGGGGGGRGGRGGGGGGFGGGGFGLGGGTGQSDGVNAVQMRFHTQFEHKKDVYEQIEMVKNDAGEWRVGNYRIQTPQLGTDPLKAR